MTQITKIEFEAAIAVAGIGQGYEPRVETDIDYRYDTYEDAEGREVAFVAYHKGEATYHLSAAE